jgi:hypothetical protein
MKQNYYYPKLLEEQLILKREAGMMKVMTMRMKKRKKMRMKEVTRTKMKRMKTKKMKKSIHLSRMLLTGRITIWIRLSTNKRKKFQLNRRNKLKRRKLFRVSNNEYRL